MDSYDMHNQSSNNDVSNTHLWNQQQALQQLQQERQNDDHNQQQSANTDSQFNMFLENMNQQSDMLPNNSNNHQQHHIHQDHNQPQPEPIQLQHMMRDERPTNTSTANNLAFTTQDAAQRAVLEVLARHNNNGMNDENGVYADADDTTIAMTNKRHGNEDNMLVVDAADMNKRQRLNSDHTYTAIGNEFDSDAEDDDDHALLEETGVVIKKKEQMEELDSSNKEQPNNVTSGFSATSNETIPPSIVGVTSFNDNDVLCGRGGGTNVHPGNKHFRTLIDQHRKIYLKARKNDKPAISRSIVRTIRNKNGRFLKKDSKTKLWYEIGDSMAREKTSQALRQRAPEMRKILFENEHFTSRQHIDELHHNQQQLFFNATAANANMNAGAVNLNLPYHQNQQQGGFGGLGGSDLGNMNAMNLNVNNGTMTNSTTGGGTNSNINPFVAMNNNSVNCTAGTSPAKADDYFNAKVQQVQQAGNASNPYADFSQNLMTAALLGGGINRITPHGA